MKSVRLEECKIGRVYDWNSVVWKSVWFKFKYCIIARLYGWKSVRLEESEMIGRVEDWNIERVYETIMPISVLQKPMYFERFFRFGMDKHWSLLVLPSFYNPMKKENENKNSHKVFTAHEEIAAYTACSLQRCQ